MMRKTLLVMLLAGVGCSSDEKKDDKKFDRTKDETVIEFDNLKSKPPSDWKEEVPFSRVGPQFAPLYQFRLPRTDGDAADAEVRISKGLRGTVKENIDRWKGQFEPAEGKKIDDVAKESVVKIGGREATRLDVSGTFLGTPADKSRQQGYRMIGIDFEGPRNRYHIVFRGPAATVERHLKGFDDWLASFK